MTHYLMIILVLLVLSSTDGRNIVKKKLHKELYAYATFAAVIIIYGYTYFSVTINASVADILNKILLHK